MKKLIILLGLIFYLTSNVANAITVYSQPSTIMINGINLSKNDVSHAEFCATTGITTVYLKNGGAVTFHTNYNEYNQINNAIVPATYVAPQQGTITQTYIQQPVQPVYVPQTYVVPSVYSYGAPYHYYAPPYLHCSLMFGHGYHHRPFVGIGII